MTMNTRNQDDVEALHYTYARRTMAKAVVLFLLVTTVSVVVNSYFLHGLWASVIFNICAGVLAMLSIFYYRRKMWEVDYQLSQRPQESDE
ncbi:hypothetical protein [Arcanobacterium ihumii]|uniref:hypothetical protein n=1 Tax=Arcanobacterium ihumii TaxID=2138162 RepID=UPI000F51BC69|nr:hypothetical protein [Arcanobacterium ihumii]